MGDDFNMSTMNVLVCPSEMGSHNRPEELRRRDRMLLRQYIDSILHCVRCNDYTVIGFGVAMETSTGCS